MARISLVGLVMVLSSVSMLPSAHASSLAACGNIDVDASATCDVKTGLSCEASCTPINCTAALYAQCKGQCTVTVPTCNMDCGATCQGNCSGNANFDCNVDCEDTCGLNCDGTCSAQCASDTHQAECTANCSASCTATCNGECKASCSANADVSCSGKCTASCTGSCNASASLACQASFQADGYLACTGGCKADCERTGEGGLFCNGSFVDHDGNLQSCVDAIWDSLNIEVDGYAHSSGSCSGNTCQGTASAGVSASCALARVGQKQGLAGGLILATVFGLGAVARRRRRS